MQSGFSTVMSLSVAVLPESFPDFLFLSGHTLLVHYHFILLILVYHYVISDTTTYILKWARIIEQTQHPFQSGTLSADSSNIELDPCWMLPLNLGRSKGRRGLLRDYKAFLFFYLQTVLALKFGGGFIESIQSSNLVINKMTVQAPGLPNICKSTSQ